MPPRARQAVPARVLPPPAQRHGQELLGPQPGLPRAVRLLVVPRHRGPGEQRARGRLADLRQRPHPQGRALVRGGGAVQGRLRALAHRAGRPGAALRGRRAHAGSPALPARLPGLRRHGQDPGHEGRGTGPGPGMGTAQPGRHLRQPRPSARPGRADPRGPVSQHPRAAAHDLPPVRRVRPRLQLRQQEHPRPHLPVRRQAPRCRDPHPLRGPPARPTAGGGLFGQLRRAPPRTGGQANEHGQAAPRRSHRRPAGPGRRRAGDALPVAAQPRLPRSRTGAGHPLLWQRGPSSAS